MERVLELWVATHILVDSELHWKTYCNPTLPPTSMHSLAQPSDEGRIPIDEVANAESYALLCSQLRAATEKRASQLSKSVMNDLERRLLQRQQSGWFETFLVALILLNCVERTCWLFRSWEDDAFAQRVSSLENANVFDAEDSFKALTPLPPQWPLDKRPPYYANQGDRFSDILHMLLKMRSLPPKATPRPEDGVLKAVDGSDENAARWFDMIKVTCTSPFPCVYLLFLHMVSTVANGEYQLSSWNNAKQPSLTPTTPAPSISDTGQNFSLQAMATLDLI